MNLFNSGIRPAVDAHLLKLAEEERDYGEYWSASSAGYCMRKNIFERLKVPHATPDDPRKQRVFTVGDIFHEWMQRITKEAGLSIAQELELQDEDLMIRGHIDDLILITDNEYDLEAMEKAGVPEDAFKDVSPDQHLILYDYKSQSSRAFNYKRPNMSYYHKMQLGTYMYMLRNQFKWDATLQAATDCELTEGRILKISKDDLRMEEQQLMWTPELETEVTDYWKRLNRFWKEKQIPPCTCAFYENGFLAKEAYNPYFYDGEPCSIKLYEKFKRSNNGE